VYPVYEDGQSGAGRGHGGPSPPTRGRTGDELLSRLCQLMRDARRVEADLIAHIAEVDERRLYVREAAPSMFAYCTEVLHLSEPEGYLRITAARASRQHPMLLTMLAEGRLHLSGIERLAPHLTRENRETLLRRAEHKSRRQIEELVAELAPRPDASATMRKLPVRRAPGAVGGVVTGPRLLLDGATSDSPVPGPDGAAKPRPNLSGINPSDDELRPDGVDAPRAPAAGRTATIEPVSPARFRVQFTASAELRDKLERLQALMRSSVPDNVMARYRRSAGRVSEPIAVYRVGMALGQQWRSRGAGSQ
jgi:hypothetical protein